MQDSAEAVDSKNNTLRPSRLRTGLLMAGSALLGGIAVVIWNRRSLTQMQSKAQENKPLPLPIEDDAIY